jgi:hypothetical protein
MDTTQNFFPMDLGSMPMQTDATGLPNDIATSQPANGQQQTRTNAFGQNVFMGVSDSFLQQHN